MGFVPSKILSSTSNHLSHIASLVPSVMVSYSASVELSAIVGCLELFHIIGVPPTRKI